MRSSDYKNIPSSIVMRRVDGSDTMTMIRSFVKKSNLISREVAFIQFDGETKIIQCTRAHPRVKHPEKEKQYYKADIYLFQDEAGIRDCKGQSTEQEICPQV